MSVTPKFDAYGRALPSSAPVTPPQPDNPTTLDALKMHQGLLLRRLELVEAELARLHLKHGVDAATEAKGLAYLADFKANVMPGVIAELMPELAETSQPVEETKPEDVKLFRNSAVGFGGFSCSQNAEDTGIVSYSGVKPEDVVFFRDSAGHPIEPAEEVTYDIGAAGLGQKVPTQEDIGLLSANHNPNASLRIYSTYATYTGSGADPKSYTVVEDLTAQVQSLEACLRVFVEAFYTDSLRRNDPNSFVCVHGKPIGGLKVSDVVRAKSLI